MTDPQLAWLPKRAGAIPPPRRAAAGRHPDLVELAGFFDYEHLPPHLQQVSAPFGILFSMMVQQLPDCNQLIRGAESLLAAKDCFVRANLPPEGELDSSDRTA